MLIIYAYTGYIYMLLLDESFSAVCREWRDNVKS